MMSDAIGTTCGAMLGSSTLTTYVESASGIARWPFWSNSIHSRYLLHHCSLPIPYLLTHPKCCNKWCTYYGRCVNARFCEEDKPTGYDRSFPCLYHYDNNGVVLFHCRWNLFRHSVVCHNETLHRSLERLELDSLHSVCAFILNLHQIAPQLHCLSLYELSLFVAYIIVSLMFSMC